MFAGRLSGEKGVAVLLEAWRDAALGDAALVLAGGGPIRARVAAASGVRAVGALAPPELRNFYAGSDVVVVPSVPTRDFLEPWGLVVNEAFDQGVPVIATTAVGAAAGGLVQHERTGLVVPAGDARALADALRRLHGDPALRERLGTAAREAVRAHSHAAWAAGMSRGLAAVGASRTMAGC
jgi:glycosyltransferase involved in cell wall biosynthesis